MRKVFEVELGARSGHFTQLILPAAPYAMLDALEKLRLEDGEAPTWATLSVFNCERIADFMDEDGTLFELNALCQQLALLDEGQLAIVEGLAAMGYEKGSRPIPMPQLIDMAYSTDRCHLVEEATDDYTLGRFCAENSLPRKQTTSRMKRSSCWISQRLGGSSGRMRAVFSPTAAMCRSTMNCGRCAIP